MTVNVKVFEQVVNSVLLYQHNKCGEACTVEHVLERLRNEATFVPSDDDIEDARAHLQGLVQAGKVRSRVSGGDLLLSLQVDDAAVKLEWEKLMKIDEMKLLLIAAAGNIRPPRVMPPNVPTKTVLARRVMDHAVGPGWAW